ncbi:hypothetical protein GW108_20135 [Escherichia coli]|nr:hypothetical protein [Escherichia coli]HAU8820942.1 hypothetical protein [Escherichia coli]
MKMKWSPSVQGFFSENNSDIPDDAFDIEDALYYELMNGQSTGKIIINSPDNYPVLTEYPAKTHEQEIAEAEGMKNILIEQANDYMNSKQWPGKAAIGRLKGEELAQYNLWLDYLDALELVDTSGAPDIEWPTPPVPPVMSTPVKYADLIMLATERRDLGLDDGSFWPVLEGIQATEMFSVIPLAPGHAYGMFMERFNELSELRKCA